MELAHYANVKLTTIDCGECGGTYAISERYRQHKFENSGTWHCPYCKTSWGFTGSEIDNLKEKLRNEAKRREWVEKDLANAENRVRAQKAAKTRLKNRIADGVCPCCNRTFQNLSRHMTSQHPDYTKDDKEGS